MRLADEPNVDPAETPAAHARNADRRPIQRPRLGFRRQVRRLPEIAEIKNGKVALYSRNGKIISRSYIEVAKALEGVEADARRGTRRDREGRRVAFPASPKRAAP
jgi:hypothetical protein